MAHAQKPDFVFRRNGRVRLSRRGRQFSRLLAAEVCASAVVMLDAPCSEVVRRVLATHSIRQFPLHFPSRASRVPSQFNWTLRRDSHLQGPLLRLCWTCRKFLTNPTAVAIPGTESYWISPLNDILYVGWMKGLRVFASLSAAAVGCVTLPFALSEVAYDIRYMCVFGGGGGL
jgi:hypothetical protein